MVHHIQGCEKGLVHSNIAGCECVKLHFSIDLNVQIALKVEEADHVLLALQLSKVAQVETLNRMQRFTENC